ncbi:hypothetical protein AVEN_80838-1 [Araneus ventricosus]|uniref:Uncharacterized protein n=1 Tax=Araneus ventricosus TaxID=182803 RepID=A0A4Y2SZJ6_ARAVE|nr:hypothetical protein AVEN_80838-1 [Araneus ventricosus]
MEESFASFSRQEVCFAALLFKHRGLNELIGGKMLFWKLVEECLVKGPLYQRDDLIARKIWIPGLVEPPHMASSTDSGQVREKRKAISVGIVVDATERSKIPKPQKSTALNPPFWSKRSKKRKSYQRTFILGPSNATSGQKAEERALWSDGRISLTECLEEKYLCGTLCDSQLSKWKIARNRKRSFRIFN